jgi:hypothetical protein
MPPPRNPLPPAALPASHRSTARRGWLALAAGIVLAATAGAYVAFAPAPTSQVGPSASPVAEATQAPSADAAEAALNLSTEDRRRIQLALTAQGFDTRGTARSGRARAR